MPRTRRDVPTDTFEQIESLADRLTDWATRHAALLIATGVAILLIAAGVSGTLAWRDARADAASTALAEVRTSYLQAMGGEGLDLEVQEPVNPEAARSIREQYLTQFLEVAEEHSGTPAAAMARLEASELHQELGQLVAALEVLRPALDDLSGRAPMRGIVWRRMAALLELQGDFAGAAEAHEAAADTPGFPLRTEALADAARAWADAGQPERARAVIERLGDDLDQGRIPPHVAARLEELSRTR